jgi:ABC-type transport system involved in Fe-S cluster assembly fused permease/ATPase subunit
VNTLDNLTTSKAVDALLNAETVALFNNQALEVRGGGLCVWGGG